MAHSHTKSLASRRLSLVGLLLVAGGAGISFNTFISIAQNSQESYPGSETIYLSPALGPPCPSLQPNTSKPHLYLITPTFTRLEQEAELTRMGQTLMHVPHLTWIVVEDAVSVTSRLRTIMSRFPSISTVIMAAAMPAKYRASKGAKPRGVANRNIGLEWVIENVDDGVVYFADDDNTYDIRLFQELRQTRALSLFPVGLVTRTGISSPIVKNGKIVGFFDGWIANRRFPVDMAGFAVNIKTLKQAHQKLGKLEMPFTPGYEEDGFLRLLGIDPKDAQPLSSNCSQVLVWHTQTRRVVTKPSRIKTTKYRDTNMETLLRGLL